MAQRSASDGPTRGSTTLNPLLLAPGFQLVVAIGGPLVPGSIVAYPFAIDASEPVTVIYDFSGGRILAFATFALLGAGFLWSLRAVSRLPSRHPAVVLVAAVPLVAAFVFVYPGGSTDVFQNIADARTLWVYHEWPMV